MPSAAARSNCSPPPLTAAPKSTAHHTGAQRLYSTVSEPAVDTNPAQHHLSSFASQFVGIAFMEGGRRAGRDVVDVDARIRLSRGSHAHPWLCGHARRRDDGLRQELAPGVKESPGTLPGDSRVGS